jgi:UDP-N-acetylmuramate--alanine ligase
MDFYGSMESLCEYFLKFINGVGEKGLAVLCSDDENIRSILGRVTVPFVTYGSGDDSEYKISQVRVEGFKTIFSLTFPSGDYLPELSLNVPGRHYALNCAGCCAVADFLGAEHGRFRKAIAAFSGVGRRFEVVGTAGGVKVVDDYAHHPTEISAVLSAFSGFSSGRIVVAFQPHRIDRTKRLATRIGASLSIADKVYILPVYRPAGSSESDDSSSRLIYQSMNSDCSVLLKDSSLEKAALEIVDELKCGDIFITVGAGSITKLGPLVLRRLQET